jgi:hypothetical protein
MPSRDRMRAGLFLLTLVSAFAAVSGVAYDFTPTHVYNPAWPAHAQFHGYLSIARTVLIMLAVIVLTWGPVRAGARWAWSAAALLLLGWLALWFIAPLIVPGTGDAPAYIFAAVLTPLSILALWLARPRA